MSGSEEEKVKPVSALLKLAMQFFKKEGYRVDVENTRLEGFSGVLREFDLIVQKGRVGQGVWVRDWNRTIGVNLVINIDKASEDVNLSNPIIVGEKFSDHAKSYANRRRVTLLTKRQITPR
jgi:galactitol-specific phosphotransferase system IIB component